MRPTKPVPRSIPCGGALLALALAAMQALGAGATGDGSAAPAAAAGGASQAAQSSSAAALELSPQFLTDPENITTGRTLWDAQCRHCHGRSAYPGKAPKLKPRKYTPESVYDRVTNGFRKMPPWKDVFSDEQRRAIVAYVLSKDFSP